MELWNRLDLVPPALMNMECSSKHIKNEICSLTGTSSKMVNYFAALYKFEKAAAYLSRFCYKWKDRLRNMHGFQIMRRINQTLLRIKNLDLLRDITNFHSFLPESSYIEKMVSLPVRSNLEHLLIRLQGMAKLLMRVVLLTKEAARYQLKQISRAFLFYHNGMFLALMGELWLLARSICRRVNMYYGELYPHLPILPECATMGGWLPAGYRLPANLAEWIGDQYEEEIVRTADAGAVMADLEHSNIFNLLQHQGTDEADDAIKRLNAVADEADGNGPVEEESLTSVPKTMLLQALRSDTGERIDAPKAARNTAGTRKVSFDPSKLNHIKSKFQVKQFLIEERSQRTANMQLVATGFVSESQFGDFNVRLMKEYNRLSSADFVKFFKEQFLLLVKIGD
ncbi:uncharacterized protein LOC131208942 [Anopheles bellator]|uniref:uncharacterized protein LOC131208942 n=1 Tax=Anopheles bellator TaxID=139047 RepID=UPI002647F5C5|nr:uncharacterized protein LOC131208942 [Anopheles bellator]